MNPLTGQLGQLVCSGWIGTHPHTGTDLAYLYLATPGGPGAPVPAAMAAVATALGLDPRPGAVTEHPTGDARVELRGGHWAALAVGPPDHPATLAERVVTAEWEAAARAGGRVALALSYRPLTVADIEAHADRSMATGQLVLGLLPALGVA